MRHLNNRTAAALAILGASLCGEIPALAQSDFQGTWILTASAQGVGVVTCCVTVDGAAVVDGTGVLSDAGTIEFASGSVDQNGRISLTIRSTNSQTSQNKTRTFTGVLDAGSGLGSGDATLTDTSGPNVNTTWSGSRASTENLCSGPGAVPISLAVSSLPRALIGITYSTTLAGKGGIPPLTLSVSGLPSGLSFNASNNQISGTPASGTEGTLSLDITVTDNVANSSTGKLVLVLGTPDSSGGSTTTSLFFPCGTIGLVPLISIFLGLCLMRVRARGVRN